MSENISKHGPDSSESDSSHSHDFRNIHEGDGLNHCIDGIRSSIKLALFIVIVAVVGHYIWEKYPTVKEMPQKVVDGVDVLIKDVAKDTEYWKQIFRDL